MTIHKKIVFSRRKANAKFYENILIRLCNIARLYCEENGVFFYCMTTVTITPILVRKIITVLVPSLYSQYSSFPECFLLSKL